MYKYSWVCPACGEDQELGPYESFYVERINVRLVGFAPDPLPPAKCRNCGWTVPLSRVYGTASGDGPMGRSLRYGFWIGAVLAVVLWLTSHSAPAVILAFAFVMVVAAINGSLRQSSYGSRRKT